MTECSADLTLFPIARRLSTRPAGKPVLVRNDGGALTSDAGMLLLREVGERFGLSERLAPRVVDRREPVKVQHDVLSLLRQRIYQIACGYEDCNDADSLRRDPALKLAVGRAPTQGDLASKPTLSRLEDGVGWQECWRMCEALVECFVERHRHRPPARIVLDVDATDDETHGHQQLSFFHGYYNEHDGVPIVVEG